LKYKIH